MMIGVNGDDAGLALEPHRQGGGGSPGQDVVELELVIAVNWQPLCVRADPVVPEPVVLARAVGHGLPIGRILFGVQSLWKTRCRRATPYGRSRGHPLPVGTVSRQPVDI